MWERPKRSRRRSAFAARCYRKKEWQGRKPLSVFESVIYLRNLPPGIGRAALICRYIWSCRPGQRTRQPSPDGVVGSYPAFSPLPPGGGGTSLLHCLKITPHCAFRRRAPFPVRTFLSIIPAGAGIGRDRSSCHSGRKFTNYFSFAQGRLPRHRTRSRA